MALNVLQSIQWPSASTIGAAEQLYLRAEPRPCWYLNSAGGIKGGPVGPGGEQRLDLSTFFGAFSLTTWCGVAGLDTVTLELTCRGRCTLQVFEDNGYEGRTMVLQRRIAGDGAVQYLELNGLKGRRGMLFPVFLLQQGDEFELRNLRYCTRTPPPHAPRLAIVMPTYRREAFVRQNVARIAAGVLADHPSCRLYVVDNGQSLQLPAHAGVELVRNPNFGGSGGFARGLLELERAAEPFTHVLFCDDDVLVNPQAIRRLLALLGYVDAETVVSGGMLKMGHKHVLHEKSANVVGMTFSSNRSNADLTEPAAVARYDEATFSTFCGWWFVCYPLAGGRRFMPAPYFVGWDDVEMGRRCNRLGLRTVSLLGVAIWHEEFEKKDVNWRWYYHARNGLITALMYEPGRLALGQLVREVLLAMQTYRYDRAEYMIDGMRAVAAGPAALKATPADELHRRLIERPQVQFADVSRWVIPDRYPFKRPKTRVRTALARLTLNGHLLPLSLFKSAREPSYPGWTVEDLQSRALGRIFRSRRVVYYEPTSGKGLLCTVDHGRFFRLLGRLLWNGLVLRLRWRALHRAWSGEHATLTSPDFWRRYLGLAGSPGDA